MASASIFHSQIFITPQVLDFRLHDAKKLVVLKTDFIYVLFAYESLNWSNYLLVS